MAAKTNNTKISDIWPLIEKGWASLSVKRSRILPSFDVWKRCISRWYATCEPIKVIVYQIWQTLEQISTFTDEALKCNMHRMPMKWGIRLCGRAGAPGQDNSNIADPGLKVIFAVRHSNRVRRWIVRCRRRSKFGILLFGRDGAKSVRLRSNSSWRAAEGCQESLETINYRTEKVSSFRQNSNAPGNAESWKMESWKRIETGAAWVCGWCIVGIC